jgi:N utilization substance protein B
VSKKKLDVSARRASRLGAVQATFQMDLGGTPSEEIIDEFVDHRLGQELEGDQYNEPDMAHFTTLIRGIISAQVEIDRAIEDSLASGWTMIRLDSTLRAILRCAVCELIRMDDIPAAIVIDEYIDLTKAFFEGPEPGFVNGLLDTISKKLK